MDKSIIRQGTINDLHLLDEFQQELGEYERQFTNLGKKGALHYWSEKELRKIFRNGAVFFAYEKDEPIGCVAAEIEKVTGDWCKYKQRGLIHILFVKKSYRNKGIGTTLLKKSIQWLKNNNIKWIGIRMLSGNDDAKQLYEKLGFQEVMVEMKL